MVAFVLFEILFLLLSVYTLHIKFKELNMLYNTNFKTYNMSKMLYFCGKFLNKEKYL